MSGPCLVDVVKETLRKRLMEIIVANGWTQGAAAQMMGISAPRMSNLFRGQMEKFSADALIELLEKANCTIDIDVSVRKPRPKLPRLSRHDDAQAPFL